MDDLYINYLRFADHVRRLAHEHNISLTYDAHEMPRAHCDGSRRVVTRPVTDAKTYVIALHEMGHIVHKFGMIRARMGLSQSEMLKTHEDTVWWCRMNLCEEYAAWEWAHSVALEWTDEMTAVEEAAVQTYEHNVHLAELTGLDISVLVADFKDLGTDDPFYPRFRQIMLEEGILDEQIPILWSQRPVVTKMPGYTFNEPMLRQVARDTVKEIKKREAAATHHE